MAQRSSQHRVFRPSVGVLVCAVLALNLWILAAPARGQHPRRSEQFKHQVEQLEQAWRTAELSGDVDAMGKLLSDDYVGINMSGQVVTKTQQLDRMRRRRTVLTKLDLEDMKVKLIGQTAIVTSRAEVEGTNEGVVIHGTYRYTRVYSRQATGGWQITNFEATRVGPPPPPPGPPPTPPESRPSPAAPAAPAAKPE
jgi:ketosteroid isomerase-like protein